MERLLLSLIFLGTGTSLVLCTLDCDASCVSSNQFELDVRVDGSNIELSWTFNQSKPIYGFQMIIYDDDDYITYESPILHFSERSMSLEHELEGQSKICLAIYENNTKILDKKCDKIVIKDLKIIIGILAGTIFLIPCIAALIYVIYKDYKVRLIEQFEEIDPLIETKTKKIQVIVAIEEEKKVDKTDKKKSVNSDTVVENKAYVHDEPEEQPAKADDPKVLEASIEPDELNTTTSTIECGDPINETETPDKSNAEDDTKDDIKDCICNDNIDNVGNATITDHPEESETVRDELKTDTVCVTEEDVSGTKL